jgi:hypothetical protein
MQWYYSKNGTQLGPVPQGELISKLATGEISPTDLVWREGMGDWLPAARVTEFQGISAASAPVISPNPSSPYAAPASPYAPQVGSTENIPNYLWQSIVVTIICCWPLGIPAIVFAAKVDGFKARGDIPGAMAASAKAKRWTLIAMAAGLVFVVIYGIAMGFGISSGNFQKP